MLDTINIRASGTSRYDTFYLPYSTQYLNIENIEIDCLVIKDNMNIKDIEIQNNYDELYDSSNYDLLDRLFYLNTVWEVEERDYDPLIAIKCNLIPFTYSDEINEINEINEIKYLLSLGGCGMDLSPRLELYQFLIDNTMGNNSLLYSIINSGFSSVEKDEDAIINRDIGNIYQFEYVTYKGAIKDVQKILTNKKAV